MSQWVMNDIFGQHRRCRLCPQQRKSAWPRETDAQCRFDRSDRVKYANHALGSSCAPCFGPSKQEPLNQFAALANSRWQGRGQETTADVSAGIAYAQPVLIAVVTRCFGHRCALGKGGTNIYQLRDTQTNQSPRQNEGFGDADNDVIAISSATARCWT
jgi:hypothetical protein